MEVPMEISYRGLEKIDFIDDLIRKKAEKLEQVAPHLISCHVAVEQDQKNQRTGNPFALRIDLNLPPALSELQNVSIARGEKSIPVTSAPSRASEMESRPR